MIKIDPMVSVQKILKILLYAYIENFDLGLWPWPIRYGLDLYNFERPSSRRSLWPCINKIDQVVSEEKILKFYNVLI